MEEYNKKLKINKINMNKIYEIKRKDYFDYFKKQKIIPKKYSNSVNMFDTKKKNLVNKYNLTERYIYSVINKTFRKQRTSNLDIDKIYSKTSIITSLLKKNYLKKKSTRKVLSFNEGNKLYNNDNINNIDINSHLMNKRQKYKSVREPILPIPIKSKKEYKKDDFEVIALCGKGAYGTVLQVKLKSEQNLQNSKKNQQEKYYAIKVIDIQSMKSNIFRISNIKRIK